MAEQQRQPRVSYTPGRDTRIDRKKNSPPKVTAARALGLLERAVVPARVVKGPPRATSTALKQRKSDIALRRKSSLTLSKLDYVTDRDLRKRELDSSAMRDVCKERPEGEKRKKRGGGGGASDWKPWCREVRKRR